MEKRRMECTAAFTENQRRGSAPVPPRFFAFKKMAKSRWLCFSTTGNVAYATFTVKRSGCASAEPYPQNRTFMVASALLICYSYFKTSCDNGHKLTKKPTGFISSLCRLAVQRMGTPSELTQRRRNSPLRAIGASFLIKYAGLTQREVADFLNAGSGSAISRQLLRYRKLLAETKKWEDLLMRCETRLNEQRTKL